MGSHLQGGSGSCRDSVLLGKAPAGQRALLLRSGLLHRFSRLFHICTDQSEGKSRILASAIGATLVNLDAHGGEDWRTIAGRRVFRRIRARTALNITNLTGRDRCESWIDETRRFSPVSICPAADGKVRRFSPSRDPAGRPMALPACVGGGMRVEFHRYPIPLHDPRW